MAKDKSKPQVPGEADPANKKSDDPGEQISVPKSMLEKMQQQIDDLSAKVAAGVRPAHKTSDEDLPDASSIDLSLITSPVLTKIGWMVPNKFGTSSAQPKG